MLQYWRWCQRNVGMMLRHFGPIHHPRPATCKYSHIPRGLKSHRQKWKILLEGRQENQSEKLHQEFKAQDSTGDSFYVHPTA
jgi:hypothetical protein